MSFVIEKIDVDAFDGDGLDIVGSDGAEILLGTGRGDFIDAGDGDDNIFDGFGDNLVLGGGGDDQIFTGFGNDQIIGGDGDDRIFSGAGDDIIEGSDGDDLIFGGDGDDTIDGGAGSDTMYGGLGDDVFVFDLEDFANGEVDEIGDFGLGEDRIFIRGLGEDDELAFDPASNSITLNGNTIINLIGPGATPVDPPSIEEDDQGRWEIM